MLNDILEGRKTSRFSRRQMMIASLGLAASAPMLSLLAACGGDDDDDDDSGGAEPTATAASGGGGDEATPTEAGAEEPTATSGSGGGSGEAQYGGKITMSLADRDITSFDPIIPTDNMSIWTMLLIYDQLVRVGPDGLSVEPGLAENWDISDDGLTYTFNLRDATFHDGSTVTAEDAAYCIDRVTNDEESQWAWIFTAIESVEATDDKTVTIQLSTVWVPFIADVALYSSSIYPKALHEEQGADLFESPVGSGPFQFDLWEKDSRAVLKKYDSFWEEGKPYLDELEFLVLTDASTRMLKFQANELDIATDVPFSQLEALSNDSNYQVQTEGAARCDMIALNTTRAPFDDQMVRQALNYAVDNEVIIENVLFGYGEPANTMLPQMLYHADDLPGYPYDLDKAKELMAGSSSPDGFEFELIVSSGDVVAQQLAQLIQVQLADIDVTVNIRLAEPGSATEEIRALQYDATKSYYTTDIIDPDELVVFGFSPLGGIDAMRTGWTNDELDQLIEEAQSEQDPATREEQYHRIQELHNEGAPVILLYYPTGRTALQSDIRDFHILPTGNYRMWEVWREQ